MAIGLLAFLWFGDIAVIQHLMLRGLLYMAKMRLQTITNFLIMRCDKQVILQRAGGGYIFIHRMLLEFFAELTSENAFQNAAKAIPSLTFKRR